MATQQIYTVTGWDNELLYEGSDVIKAYDEAKAYVLDYAQEHSITYTRLLPTAETTGDELIMSPDTEVTALVSGWY